MAIGVVQVLLFLAGFRGEQIDIMSCIAQHESSLRPAVVHVNTNGSKDIGLFQINDKWWGEECKDLYLYHAYYNTLCAKRVFDKQGYDAWIVYRMGKCTK